MASRGVNKVILVGNLGQDPEVRYMPSGGAVANLTLATSESWRDKQTGEMKEQTEWHRVVMFGKLAEVAGEYLRKGSQVYIEGQLRTRKWTDQSGQERYTTEINVPQIGGVMQMLGGRQGGGAPAGGQQQGVGVSRNNLSSRRAATSSAAARSRVHSNPRQRRLTNRQWILTTTFRSDFGKKSKRYLHFRYSSRLLKCWCKPGIFLLVLLSLYPFQKEKRISYGKMSLIASGRLASAHHYPAEVHKCTAITRIVLNMKRKLICKIYNL